MSENILLSKELIESEAFISLPGAAAKLLLIFISKAPPRHNHIIFTYKEAFRSYKFTQPKFTRSIDALLAHGFITVKHGGGRKNRDHTQYLLSNGWKKWVHGAIIGKRPPPANIGFMTNRYNRKSSSSYPSGAGYIYVLQSMGLCKIGQSKKMKNRLRNYTTLPDKPMLLICEEVEDMGKIEKELHKMFAHKREKGEWFKLTQFDIRQIKRFFKNKPVETKQIEDGTQLGLF